MRIANFRANEAMKDSAYALKLDTDIFFILLIQGVVKSFPD